MRFLLYHQDRIFLELSIYLTHSLAFKIFITINDLNDSFYSFYLACISSVITKFIYFEKFLIVSDNLWHIAKNTLQGMVL